MRISALAMSTSIVLSATVGYGDTQLPVLPLNADRCAMAYALTGRVIVGCPQPSRHDQVLRNAQPDDGYIVNFEFDSDNLSKPSQSHLNKLASILNGPLSDLCLMLIGHADSVGAASYNQKLSQKRATSVRLYLAGPGTVTAGRIKTDARGESQPLPAMPTEDARNRRVEILARPKTGDNCG